MKRAIFVVAVCAALAVPALADLGTVQVREVSMGPNLTMTIHRSGATSDNKTVYIGIQNLALQQNGTDPIPDIVGYDPTTGMVSAFCIDIWDWSSGSYNVYSLVELDGAPDPAAGPMTSAQAARLAELLDAHWGTDPLTAIQSAALQAAIWEIVNETTDDGTIVDISGYNVGSGVFSLTGGDSLSDQQAARVLANDWLSDLSYDGIDFSSYLALSNDGVQDYVVQVPVPAAFVLGLLGMGAAGLRLRKRA